VVLLLETVLRIGRIAFLLSFVTYLPTCLLDDEIGEEGKWSDTGIE